MHTALTFLHSCCEAIFNSECGRSINPHIVTEAQRWLFSPTKSRQCVEQTEYWFDAHRRLSAYQYLVDETSDWGGEFGACWREDSESIETISSEGKPDGVHTDLFGSNQRHSLLILALMKMGADHHCCLLHRGLLNLCSLKVILFQGHNSSGLSHTF